MGFKEGAAKARPVLLEPIMAVEVVTPEEYMGDVIGDLNSRRGQIQAMNPQRGRPGHRGARCRSRRCSATRPTSARKTQGRATYTMQFTHYAQVPNNIAETIVTKAKGAAAAAK